MLAVSVGNETMVELVVQPDRADADGRLPAHGAQPDHQPVTTDDNYAFWASAPTVITDEIDFAALHTYAELDTVLRPDALGLEAQNDVPEAERARR